MERMKRDYQERIFEFEKKLTDCKNELREAETAKLEFRDQIFSVEKVCKDLRYDIVEHVKDKGDYKLKIDKLNTLNKQLESMADEERKL